jgi:hypothetical protein
MFYARKRKEKKVAHECGKCLHFLPKAKSGKTCAKTKMNVGEASFVKGCRFYESLKIPRCHELQVGQPKSPVAEVPKRVVCVNCGRKFKTTLAVKGGAEPVCFSCRKKEEKPAPANFTCSECGESDHVTAYKVPGIEGFVCYRCLESLKKDRPTVMSFARVEPAKFTCGVCFKSQQGHRYRVPGKEFYLCETCVRDMKEDNRLECPGCHLKFSTEESNKIRNFPDAPRRCTSCRVSFILVNGKLTYIKPLGEVVTETPIHERFLVVEGRSCGSWTTTYMQEFRSQEDALRILGTHNMSACKMFRLASTAPIEIEELSLGYDVKVVKKVKR